MEKIHLLTIRILLLLAMLGGVISSNLAQSTLPKREFDSLWAAWKNPAISDSNRLVAIGKIIWDGYLSSNPDSAFYYAQMKYDYAQKSGSKYHMAKALNTMAIISKKRKNNPLALNYYNRTLALYKECGYHFGYAATMITIGAFYYEQGQTARCLDYYNKSLTYSESVGSKTGMAAALSSIGGIYLGNAEHKKALTYYLRALKLTEEANDIASMNVRLNNVGAIYVNLGDYTRALAYLKRSLTLYEEAGNKAGVALCLGNIGAAYSKIPNHRLALDYCLRSLKLNEEQPGDPDISFSLNNVGSVYQDLGNHVLAIKYCELGLAMAIKHKSKENQRDACQYLYNSCKASGKYDKALIYLEKYNALNDSLNARDLGKNLQHMEFAKQMLTDSLIKAAEKLKVQEAFNAEVRKKNLTRNILIAISLLVLLIAAGIYSRLRYIRKTKVIIEQERDRSDNLLLNILPGEIARELKEFGKTVAQDFDRVTVLFTDFQRFTETSAKLSAPDLVQEINACFEAFDHITEKHKVEKIKTIGDAYMAVGGLPMPFGDSVKNTILAALEMQQFITKRKAENDLAGKPAFEMRAGIHTGPVVAGIVGVKKFQYDIWGDTVNTASRLENAGAAGKVNISRATYDLIMHDPAFLFESRGSIEAKGKGEIEMFFVRKA